MTLRLALVAVTAALSILALTSSRGHAGTTPPVTTGAVLLVAR
jgi:hypothetical protein